jgi:hypothetical protein
MFSSGTMPATPFTRDGFGDPLNYGFRTKISDGQALFVGSANPFNMKTDPDKNLGGWHLYSITPQ